jgi:aryl-alcohol dehydrogenase-like predicted oxidoreductase
VRSGRARAVEELRLAGATLAQAAIRWILMFETVSTVIPGAKSPGQTFENAAAADADPLEDRAMALVTDVYARRIAPLVEDRW